MCLAMEILIYIASSVLVGRQVFIKLEDCKTSFRISFCGSSSSFHKSMKLIWFSGWRLFKKKTKMRPVDDKRIVVGLLWKQLNLWRWKIPNLYSLRQPSSMCISNPNFPKCWRWCASGRTGSEGYFFILIDTSGCSRLFREVVENEEIYYFYIVKLFLHPKFEVSVPLPV